MSERMRATAGLAVMLLMSTASASAQPRLGGSAPAVSPSRGHEQHGTPKGWKFAWPKGDPAKGRAVFVKIECYSCHEVRGEKFPAPTPTEKGKVGPELSAMGPLHEVDYFAEAIINPSAVIEKGKASAHVLDCPVVGWSQRTQRLFTMNHTGGWLGRAHVSGRRA